MYICSCHAVTDGAIKNCVKSGTRTYRGVVKQLKVGTQCGICAVSAKQIFDQARKDNPPAPRATTDSAEKQA